MAKFPYDVNTARRIIDVYKQFKGGLKTVDTDDALGSVFLRQAENISLSEFGFIEKRYGTFENFKAGLPVTTSSYLQGYWEFLGKYIIVALDGRLYTQNLSTPTASFTEVTQFYTEEDATYPRTLASYLGLESDYSVGSGFTGFQTDREMGAAIISDVLYLFTGKYPVYFSEEEGVLKAYLFAKETPSYAEIVVTGHNLLEDDYDELYYGDVKDPTFEAQTGEYTDASNTQRASQIVTFNSPQPFLDVAEEEENDLVIKGGSFSPTIGFAKDGEIEFKMAYGYKSKLTEPLNIDTTSNDPAFLNQLTLKSISGRPSGPGATDLSFTDLVLSEQKFNQLNNVPDTLDDTVNIAQTPFSGFNDTNVDDLNLAPYNAGETAVGDDIETKEHTVYEKYWGWKADYVYAQGTDIHFGLQDTGNTLFKVKYKPFEIHMDGINDAGFAPNKLIGLKFFDNVRNKPVDLESKLEQAKISINAYGALDTRSSEYVPLVREYRSLETSNMSARYDYVLYGKEFIVFKKKDNYLYPIWRYLVRNWVGYSEDQIPSSAPEYVAFSGNEYIEINTNAGPNGDAIQVNAYEADGTLLTSQIVSYRPDPDDSTTLAVSGLELDYALPMLRDERTSFNAMRNQINKGTIIEVYVHKSNADELYKSFVVGKSPEVTFVNGEYQLTLPQDLPTSGVSHYKLVFKTTDVNITSNSRQDAYLAQTINTSTDTLYPHEDSFFYDSTTAEFWSIGTEQSFNPLMSSTVDEDQTVYIYPNLSQFVKLSGTYPFIGFDTDKVYFDLFPITTASGLKERDSFGTMLNVKVSKGLLSGTYDFRFVYELKQQQIDYSNLDNPVDLVEPKELSFIFKDVPISPEKLTDYTFYQGNKAHPVWSCNKVIDHFNKLMIWGSKEMPQALFYSFPDRPFYFPSKFYLEFTNEQHLPIVSVVPYSKILVVQTEASTWGVKGNSGLVDAPSPYIEFSINSSFGTIAPKSVRPVRNKLFFLSRQGVVALNSLYAVDDTYNVDLVDRNIKNIVPQDKDAVGIQFDNQYWLNFPNNSITLRWYINQNAWVQDKYLSWSDFNGVFKYQIRDGELEFITHPSTYDSGVHIFKVGVDYELPVDISQPVASKFETSFLNQNYPFHPKNYKETKLDFTLQNEYNNSTTSLYTMNDNEDITDLNIHFIDNIAALPNHFYRVGYDFTPQTRDLDAGTFSTSYVDTYDGDNFLPHTHTAVDGLIFKDVVELDARFFETTLTDSYDGGSFTAHASTIVTLDGYDTFVDIEEINEAFSHLGIESVSVREFDTNTVYDLDFTIADDHIIFQMPNVIKGSLFDVRVVGNFKNYIAGASVTDVTFDDKLTFKTWVVSEDKTLNLDNINSYDQAKADVDFNLANRLGTWVFGSSDFGKTVTAVKTIKLSGKGYNAKLYMEDNSKSKWTLESLGLTYKMKRARSR
jgi:hypothetical protein